MGKPLCYDAGNIEVSQSFINKIYGVFSDGIHFAAPVSSLRTNELDSVRAVLEMLQGFSSSLFYWDDDGKRFRAKRGIYVAHLSQTSLHSIVDQFIYAASCLQLVEILVTKIEKWVRSPPPTLRAFACSASAWLRRLRGIPLKEQTKTSNGWTGTTPTLLGLTNSLSSLCSGAEYLLQTVHGAIPQAYFDSNSSVPAADVAVHILDYLYMKLDEVCLVQGGEEEVYQMILHMFIGSLLPYIEGLDSWLFEGTLEDPFEEMFFYANETTSVDDTDFWEKSYLFRQIQRPELDFGLSSPFDKKEVCQRESISMSRSKRKEQSNGPLFIKDIAKAIVSAGKSLQLIRHVPIMSSVINGRGDDFKAYDCHGKSKDGFHHGQSIVGLTLSEVLCVSLAGLIGLGDHIFRYLCQDDWCKTKIHQSLGFCSKKEKVRSNESERLPMSCSEKIWYRFLVDTLFEKGLISVTSEFKDGNALAEESEEKMIAADVNRLPLLRSLCPENPVITLCQGNLSKNRNSWKVLNLSRNFYLPPLNDEALRKGYFW